MRRDGAIVEKSMANTEQLKALCYDDSGNPKSKPDCRAALINHLILDEMMDVDDAEELTEKTLDELNLWIDEAPSEQGEQTSP